MKKARWLWPITILLSAITAAGSLYAAADSPLRPFVVFWFLLVCPGMALVRLLHLDERAAEWTLAIALSLSLTALLAISTLYAGAWSPEHVFMILIAVTVSGALLQLLDEAGRAVAHKQREGAEGARPFPASYNIRLALSACASALGARSDRKVPPS